ncbi:MAG: hypothetical protein HQK52_05585 [Oligoflexia bacterium]|nr:hypothetical protein [Oligoflexia bacterium]
MIKNTLVFLLGLFLLTFPLYYPYSLLFSHHHSFLIYVITLTLSTLFLCTHVGKIYLWFFGIKYNGRKQYQELNAMAQKHALKIGNRIAPKIVVSNDLKKLSYAICIKNYRDTILIIPKPFMEILAPKDLDVLVQLNLLKCSQPGSTYQAILVLLILFINKQIDYLSSQKSIIFVQKLPLLSLIAKLLEILTFITNNFFNECILKQIGYPNISFLTDLKAAFLSKDAYTLADFFSKSFLEKPSQNAHTFLGHLSATNCYYDFCYNLSRQDDNFKYTPPKLNSLISTRITSTERYNNLPHFTETEKSS